MLVPPHVIFHTASVVDFGNSDRRVAGIVFCSTERIPRLAFICFLRIMFTIPLQSRRNQR
jgi:hypothetical protein